VFLVPPGGVREARPERVSLVARVPDAVVEVFREGRSPRQLLREGDFYRSASTAPQRGNVWFVPDVAHTRSVVRTTHRQGVQVMREKKCASFSHEGERRGVLSRTICSIAALTATTPPSTR
jgi:hypothetical protein